MQDLYRTLNLRSKLDSGQAMLELRSTGPVHVGEHGDLLRSQIFNIKLSANDYRICVAHRMLKNDGSATEPDPKYFHIDELKLYLDPDA